MGQKSGYGYTYKKLWALIASLILISQHPSTKSDLSLISLKL